MISTKDGMLSSMFLKPFISHSLFKAILISFLFVVSTYSVASTLQTVLERGDLNCGVYPDDIGRSAIALDGTWKGFYVDFCRATAAAVLGNPDYVHYVEVGAKTRFTSLVEKKADVVMYSSTWTIGRENRYQISFPTIYLFDGQGVIVRKNSGIQSMADLDNKTICVTGNTTTQTNIEDYIASHKLNTNVIYSNGDNFFRGSVCDAYTADKMNLYVNLANRTDRPDEYDILPGTLSREPIGPMVRNDDPQWERIIRSIVHAVILAEEKGITAKNVDEIRQTSHNVEVSNLLGKSGDIGTQLGLDNDWAYRVIKTVGNYGEIFDHNFGQNTQIKAKRGLNATWENGGVLFAPPFK